MLKNNSKPTKMIGKGKKNGPQEKMIIPLINKVKNFSFSF